jgi:hypothetical protein
MAQSQMPQTSGWYWARSSKRMGWYDIIVEVYGTHPFFRVEGTQKALNGIGGVNTIDQIEDFGPKIERPEVPNEIILKI